MAKRQRGMTKKKIEKWLKEGRGQGLGIDYKPWLRIQDVPSNGRSHRETGMKIPRIYSLLSDLENRYFNILDYASNVIDIREQFPLLPIEETVYIAEELGIKHPADPSTGENIVMTTDFLVTISDKTQPRLLARTVKYTSDLGLVRNIEKLEIERRYWGKQDVDWGIVTDQEVNKTLANNIKAVRKYYDLRLCGLFENLSVQQVQFYLSQLTEALCGDSESVSSVCKAFDERNGLELGMSLALFKHLVASKQIDIDIVNQPLELVKPITIGVPSHRISEVKVI